MKTTLIISSLSERYYYDSFVSEAGKNLLDVYILDPELFVNNSSKINLKQNPDGSLAGTIEVVKLGRDKNKMVEIDIQDIAVAWYLRVMRETKISEIQDDEKRFKWSETLWAVDSFLQSLDCQWINTFEAIERCLCNKLTQQKKALAVGLNVPRTILTNDPSNVESFCYHNGNQILVKSIGQTKLD